MNKGIKIFIVFLLLVITMWTTYMTIYNSYATSFSTIDSSDIISQATDKTGIARKTTLIIRAILTITQIMLMTLSLVSFILFLYNIIIILPKMRYIQIKHNLSPDEKNEIESKIKNVNKKCAIYLVISCLLLSLSFLKEITLNMSKPIIYVYTEKDNTPVSITLGNPELLTCTYPNYNKTTGWNVIANKNGDLIGEDGRKYYALYWEGEKTSNKMSNTINEGFCVRGKDTAIFLEEKLEILGLNEKEAEEFIIYWLPELEKNNYNLIRFQTIDEINQVMPLSIDPKPDTLIRIMMTYKGINHKSNIPEQQLVKTERVGYTVVEWGGLELK